MRKRYNIGGLILSHRQDNKKKLYKCYLKVLILQKKKLEELL